MNLNILPMVNLIVLGAIVSVILGIMGWLRASDSRLGKTFAIFSFGIALWILSYALEVFFTSYAIKVFWANMQFVGAAIAQVSFLVIAMIFTTQDHLVKPITLFGLCLIPIGTIIIAFTNASHHLLRQFPGIIYVRHPISFVSLAFDYGPWYWVNAAYMLSTVLLGSIFIGRFIVRSNQNFRSQGLAIIIGILLPWAANLIIVLGLNPIAPLDITVFALMATNIIFAVAIFRHRLFDIIPIARDTLIESLPDAVMVLNQHFHIVDVNPASKRIFNQSGPVMIGQHIDNFLPNSIDQLIDQKETNHQPLFFEIQLNQNSHPKFFNVSITPLSNNSSAPDGWLINLSDITQVKESEIKIKQLLEAEREQRILADALRESSNILSAALDTESIMDNLLLLVRRVVPFDYARLLQVENGMASISRQSGYEHLPADGTGQTKKVSFNISQTSNLQWMAEHCEPLFISDVDQYEGWIKLDKDVVIRSWVGAPIYAHSDLIGFLSLSSTQPNQYQKTHADWLNAFAGQVSIAFQTARLFDELRRMAITDSLTSLFNRRHFFDLARLEFERARRYGEELSVIMLDIDYFKRVNDSYGHVAGDLVLATLARVCRADLREMDILARYGGEEFVILLPNTDVNAAAKAAERLRQKMESMDIELNTTSRRKAAEFSNPSNLPARIRVTISLGVSSLDNNVSDLENLINRSDQALYEAKQSGRNCVRCWN